MRFVWPRGKNGVFKSFLVMMFQKHAKLSVRCNNYETKVIYRYTLYFSTLITPMRSRVYGIIVFRLFVEDKSQDKFVELKNYFPFEFDIYV